MTHPVRISESHEHAACLHEDGRSVTVYRKGRGGMNELTVIGQGRWEDGIIRGSGVNCGVLVHLEPSLRAQAGTA